LGKHNRGIIMQNKSIFYFISVLAIILKCWLTIRFCWALDGNNIEATVLGLINDLAQLGFGLLAIYYMGAKRVGLFAIAAACTFVSMMASLGFFVESDRASQARAIERTEVYQQLQSKRDRLLQMNVADMQVAERYESYERITAAKNLRADVLKRENQLSQIAIDLDLLERNPPEEMGSPMFAGLARVTGVSSNKIRLFAYVYLSILLEIIALVSLSVCTKSSVSVETRSNHLLPEYAESNKPLGLNTSRQLA
tara:strand:+ start:923 stop:1681 length:759 start_codon:yes stop_codon:yes gene_type:complete